MRIILERSILLKALNHVYRVVERRNTIPILSNVHLATDGEELRFKATDLDLEVLEKAPAIVEQPGAITVPAHMFFDIVRKFPEGSEVMLTSDDEEKTLNISSGKAKFSLQALPHSDFPDITVGEFSHTFKLPAALIKQLIDHTQFAISTEETRYYLNGIFFHTVEERGKNILRTVATDGHRLALAQIEAPAGSEEMPQVIIPRKAVNEIQKLVEDPESVINLEISETKIRLTNGSLVITSKLIDGSFPDYNRVIPHKNDRKLTLDKSNFAAAVDRVSTISSERGRAVKLSISKEKIILSVNNPDSGSAMEELPANHDSENIDIGFNSRYLLDITNQLVDEEVTFMLADSGSPALIRDSSRSDTTYVLMPMRV